MAAELRTRRWHLDFAPEVEAHYEADQQEPRRRELVRAGVVGLLVYDLFLANDLLVRPEVFADALVWRLGCLSAYGAAVLALVRRGLPARWREAAMASSIVVATFASGMIFHRTTSPAGNYDPFVFSLIFMAGNIAFPLRFVHAIVSSAIAVVVAAAFVLSHAVMPAEAKLFALALLPGTAVFTVLASYRMERAARQSYLMVLREELRSRAALRTADEFAALSHTDALTQLANRRAFEAALQRHWQQAAERHLVLALLILDIDNFKRYNDRFGHLAGDECLRQVAASMRANVREGDFVARLGGEEFVVLQAATKATVLATAERLRLGVERLAIPHDGVEGQGVVTLSIGVALAQPAPRADPTALIAAADAALYGAKRGGRNRWVLAIGHALDVEHTAPARVNGP